MIDMFRIKGCIDARGNITCIDEIARLLAVAVNRNVFARC